MWSCCHILSTLVSLRISHFHFSQLHFSSVIHCVFFFAVRPFSNIPLFIYLFSFFPLLLYVSFLYRMPTALSTLNCVARCYIRHDVLISMVRYVDDFCDRLGAKRFTVICLPGIVGTGGDKRHGPECDTSVVLARNLAVIEGVAACQNEAFFSNTPTFFVLLKKWGMIE